MFDIYQTLRRRYNQPVLPIALYLFVGGDGIGWDAYEETLWDRKLLRFEYPYIGLPALEAEPYLTGPNLLGAALAALMRLPAESRAELKWQTMQRIAGSAENPVRQHELAECLEAYFPLKPGEAQEFDRLQESDPSGKGKKMISVFDARGMRAMIQRQLEKRFGPLSSEVLEKLKAVPNDQLFSLGEAILDAKSLQDLGLEEPAAKVSS
jgi:Domain of unknown function (DUF4351)